MKVAVLSESPADETALAVLLQALISEPLHILQPGLRARGWPSVNQILPAVLRHLHFCTDADGLVVVVDADDSVVHTDDHEVVGYFHPDCRLCRLRATYRQTVKHFPVINGRKRLPRAIGVAVPAIEAWYLCGREAQVTEEHWIREKQYGRMPYTRRELKARVYGTERPTLEWETQCALREVYRHRTDTRRLENDFPGFAHLARDFRSWSIGADTQASRGDSLASEKKPNQA